MKGELGEIFEVPEMVKEHYESRPFLLFELSKNRFTECRDAISLTV